MSEDKSCSLSGVFLWATERLAPRMAQDRGGARRDSTMSPIRSMRRGRLALRKSREFTAFHGVRSPWLSCSQPSILRFDTIRC